MTRSELRRELQGVLAEALEQLILRAGSRLQVVDDDEDDFHTALVRWSAEDEARLEAVTRDNERLEKKLGALQAEVDDWARLWSAEMSKAMKLEREVEELRRRVAAEQVQ